MEDFLTLFVIMAMAVTYATHILLLERKTSHFGPFPSKSRFVVFHTDFDEDGTEIARHAQPVALFDRIRRLFGAYSIQGLQWNVRDGALSEVWTCPKCLSFWIALLPALILAVYGVPFLFPFYVLALAGVSSIVNVNWL